MELKPGVLMKAIKVAHKAKFQEEFDKFKDFIQYDFTADNHFTELKEQEIFKERLDALQTASEYVGQYFSHEYVRKYILRQTEEDIEVLDKQMKDEKETMGDQEDDGFSSY